MLFGVSYYHEYQPFERLAEDVAMMRAAAMNYARVGDAIWTLCEPTPGRFELDWFERILDALHQADIRVILATPTYAVPAWFARRYPEAMSVSSSGRRASFGGRQNVDISHPTYRYHAERIIRRLLERYASHPAIIGFQVDNETGSGMSHNDGVLAAFTDWLRARFGTVERLNEVWGLNYWSHRLHEWSELWPPAPREGIGTGESGNTNPGYDLEWRRFQASLTTDFLAWQANIVREYASADQYVIQDVVGGHGRGDSDRYQIGDLLDVPAANFPHGTQEALAHPPRTPEGFGRLSPDGGGPAQLYLRADIARLGSGRNFLVTEMNPISVGRFDNTFPGYDGQWRLAAYACVSRGADALAYWHWHSLHYGAETYSHGVLNHDYEPNRCYDELAAVGAELAEHGELLTGLTPDADVGLVYSYDSRYALEFQPCLKKPDGSGPDSGSYQRIFDRFYTAFFDARAQAEVVPPDGAFDRFRVLVVPALYIADDATLERLAGYAERGGHLVVSFRTGYADEYARARWQRAPGVLRKAVGASYNLYSNLASPLPVRATAGGLTVPDGARAEGWADELVSEGASALLHYDHPHFGRFPAVTTQPYGSGRVTYVGTLPDPVLGRALAEWAVDTSDVPAPGRGLAEQVRVTGATSRGGRRLWFASNWDHTEATVTLPVATTGLRTGVELPAGDALTLPPWSVEVLAER